MNFLQDIFDILSMPESQRHQTIENLEILIGACTFIILINKLPKSELDLVKQLGNINVKTHWGAVSDIVRRNFTTEEIKDEEKMALGLVLIEYFNDIFENKNLDMQIKAREVLLRNKVTLLR